MTRNTDGVCVFHIAGQYVWKLVIVLNKVYTYSSVITVVFAGFLLTEMSTALCTLSFVFVIFL